MKIFCKGISNIIEINPNSFISTIELAEKSKNLLKENSSEWVSYLRKFKIDLEFISEFCGNIMPRPERELINGIYKSFIPKLVIIKKGLMSGFYIYSTDIKKAFFYFENPNNVEVKALKIFSLNNNIPEYDFVISYSNKDVSFTRDLFQMLSFNFKLYFLDIDKVEEDPLWQIRYREAMYHSHYFIPVFSKNYLTTQGALSEFFESVNLNIDFRTITFYNYFIPLILGNFIFDNIKSLIEDNNFNDYSQHFNYNTKLFFDVLNDINFGMELENYSFKEIVLFLKSILVNNKENLINNSKTLSDYGFIKILLKQTDFIIYSKLGEFEFSDEKFPALKVVTLFINKSTNNWNIIDVLSDGRCINRQFTTEIQSDAKEVNKKTFEEIIYFFQNEE